MGQLDAKGASSVPFWILWALGAKGVFVGFTFHNPAIPTWIHGGASGDFHINLAGQTKLSELRHRINSWSPVCQEFIQFTPFIQCCGGFGSSRNFVCDFFKFICKNKHSGLSLVVLVGGSGGSLGGSWSK